MNGGVPYTPDRFPLFGGAIEARPKSQSFTQGDPSQQRKLSGFTSRWITCTRCISASASNISRKRPRSECSFNTFVVSKACRSVHAHFSITTYEMQPSMKQSIIVTQCLSGLTIRSNSTSFSTLHLRFWSTSSEALMGLPLRSARKSMTFTAQRWFFSNAPVFWTS